MGGLDFLMFGVNGVICCEKRPLGDSFKSLQSLLPMLPGTKNEEKHKKKQEKYCPWQTQTKISSQNVGKDKRYKNSKQQQTDWCCEGQIDKQKNRRRKIFCENLGTDSTDALQLKSTLVALFRFFHTLADILGLLCVLVLNRDLSPVQGD